MQNFFINTYDYNSDYNNDNPISSQDIIMVNIKGNNLFFDEMVLKLFSRINNSKVTSFLGQHSLHLLD